MDNENNLTPEEMDAINAALSAAIDATFPAADVETAGIDAETKDQLEMLAESLDLRDVTPSELSIVLGITEKRISQLWQAGHIPAPRKDGMRCYYPLLETVRGYITFLKDRKKGA